MQGKAEFERDVKATNDNIDKQLKALNKLKDESESLSEKKENLEGQLTENHENLVIVNRSIDSKQNELDLLQSMIDNLEGFPESIKFLTQKWSKKAPILSDILDVKDEYKAVIEHFLEPYLNHFIVDNIHAAKEAINVLKQAQKGKAHFFLLDKIDESLDSRSAYKDLVFAGDIVTVDSKYQKLLLHLLKDVYIYTNQDDSIESNEYDDLTILSANGTYVKKAVSISGGSVGLFEGKKIGRKKNLEKLQKQIKKYND